MADGQVFRIETIVDATNNIDVSTFEKAADAIDKVKKKGEQLGDALNKSVKAKGFSDIGKQAQDAEGKVDKFSKSMQKTQEQLDKIAKRHEIAIELKDRALTVLKNIGNTAKALTSKVFYITMRVRDFVTAPLRGLWNTVINPISMALGALGIGFGAGDIVKTFNDFEVQMGTVSAVTQATAEDFQAMRELAVKLGNETKFSAAEAAEGMTYLGMAGWETEQILKAMPGMLSLAAAGATDLGTAADIVSDVMTAMQIDAGDASKAADIFAQTAASSNTSIEMLGDTMKYAAPIAHSFGMNLQEASAIAGMMANAGIKGTQAGTAMRSALLRLADPTTEMQELMKSLNLSFVDGEGNMKNITQIVSDVNKAFSGMGQAQKLAAAQTLFGVEAASGWLGVLDQGEEELAKFIELLDNCTGAAEQMSNVQIDNLAGDLDELDSALDGAKIALMDKLNPYVREFVQNVTGMIPGASDALVGFVDTIIERAGALKARIDEMTSSDAWKNADFAGKLAIAWDDIIVTPFEQWWSSGGSDAVTGYATKIGTNMGTTLSAVIAGSLALISGQDVTGSDLNLSPLAAAGFDAGAAFTDSFIAGFDANRIAQMIPDAISALFTDASTLLPGGADASGTSWISALLLGTGAAKVAEFFGSIGINLQTVGDALALCKTGIEAFTTLPAPVLAAGAMIAGVAAGVAIYNGQLEAHKEKLMNMGDELTTAVEAYKTASQELTTVQNLIDEREQLKGQLAIAENYTPEQVAQAKEDLEALNQQAVAVKTNMEALAADFGFGSIAEAETVKSQIEAINTQITTLESYRESIKKDFAMGKISETDMDTKVADINGQIATLESSRETLKAQFEVGGLDYADFTTSYNDLKSQLETLQSERSALEATIKFSGISEEEKAAIIARIAEIDAALVGLSNGMITQYELENGMIEQKLGLLEQEKQIQADIARAQAATKANEIRSNLDFYTETIRKNNAELEKQNTKAEELAAISTKAYEYQVKALALENEYNNAGDGFDYFEWEGRAKAWNEGYKRDVVDPAAQYGITSWVGDQSDVGFDFAKFKGEDGSLATTDARDMVLKTGEAMTGLLGRYEELNAENEKAYSSMKALYDFDASEAIAGILGQGESLEEYAQNYASLTAEQRANFDAALDAVRELNAEASYLPDEMKMDVTGYWEKATQSTGQAVKAAATGYANVPDYTGFNEQLKASEQNYLAVAAERDAAYQRYAEYQSAVATGDVEAIRAAAQTLVDNAYVNGEQALNSMWIDDHTGRIFGKNGDPDSEIQRYLSAMDNQTSGAAASWMTMGQGKMADLPTMNAHLEQGTQYYAALNSQIELCAQAQADLNGMQEVYSSYTATGASESEFSNLMEQYTTLRDSLAEGGIELPEITNLEQLSSALTTLETTKTNLEQQATAVGENLASLAETVASLDSLQTLGVTATTTASQISAMAGTITSTYNTAKGAANDVTAAINAIPKSVTTIHNIITKYTTIGSPSGGSGRFAIGKNAEGGIYADGAFLSWVAEDGPEAIIPLGSKRRDRGLDLWYRAGQELGVMENADGGLYGVHSLSDGFDSLSDDDGEYFSMPGSGAPRGQNNVSVQSPVTINVNVEGADDPNAVVRAIKDNRAEIADMMCGTIAEAMEEILANR